MTKRSLEVTILGLALTLTGACKGRTAAWEEGTSKSPEPAPAAAGDSAEKPGQAAWDARSDKAKVLEAIAAWEQVVGCTAGTTSPKDRCANASTAAANKETLAMLTRANYFYADSYLRGSEAEYLEFMDRAVWWGERALISASPEFADKMRNKGKFADAIVLVGKDAQPAMYWYASALGKWARAKGFGVVVGQKDNIKATMTRALELDPTFFHGGPHRYFGAYYAVAPAFAGGDTNKSADHFKKSLELAPYYLGTKVLMAENLAVKLDDAAMFDRLLKEVLEADLSTVPPEILPEMKVEQEKARELQKKKADGDLF